MLFIIWCAENAAHQRLFNRGECRFQLWNLAKMNGKKKKKQTKNKNYLNSTSNCFVAIFCVVFVFTLINIVLFFLYMMVWNGNEIRMCWNEYWNCKMHSKIFIFIFQFNKTGFVFSHVSWAFNMNKIACSILFFVFIEKNIRLIKFTWW